MTTMTTQIRIGEPLPEDIARRATHSGAEYAAYSYGRRLRDTGKRTYADRYRRFLMGTYPGEPPETCSPTAAQAVRERLRSILAADWTPQYSEWRHGGWYVDNCRYPSGAVGCVSRNYPDGKWRIVCDSRPGSFPGGPNDRTYPDRDSAARAERELIAAGILGQCSL